MSYRVNSATTLRAWFFDETGALADPTTVTLKVRDPDGVTDTYTYSGASITRDALGKFSKQVTLDQAGVWAYHWKGTGTVVITDENTVEVEASEYGLD